MAVVTMRQLLEAGVHFGHQTRRWDPKMRPFIFGDRNGIHIVDLRQTLEQIETAHEFIKNTTSTGGTVLFVGTKKQAQASIKDAAVAAGMPYVNHRWLGGMLTNFQTINQRIQYMLELERMDTSGEMNALPKKERLRLRRELFKLQTVLGGVRDMTRVPDAVFVIDIKNEHIAVAEAARLGIPIVAVVDTNCDPDPIDLVIPGNDDAIRASQLLSSLISDAARSGRELHEAGHKEQRPPEAQAQEPPTPEVAAPEAAKPEAAAPEAAEPEAAEPEAAAPEAAEPEAAEPETAAPAASVPESAAPSGETATEQE